MRWFNLNCHGASCYDAIFWGVDGTSYKFPLLGSISGTYGFNDYLQTVISPTIEYAKNTAVVDAVRIFMSWNVWEYDPATYLSRLDSILERCKRFNLKVSLVLWSNEGAPNGLLGPALDYVTNGTTNELVDVRSFFNPANSTQSVSPLVDLLSPTTAGFGLNVFPMSKIGSYETKYNALLQNPGMRNILRGSSFFTSTRSTVAPLDVNNVDGGNAYLDSIVTKYSDPLGAYYDTVFSFDIMHAPLQISKGRPLIQSAERDAVYTFIDSTLTRVSSILSANSSSQKVAISPISTSFYDPASESINSRQANIYIPLSVFASVGWASKNLLNYYDSAGSETVASSLLSSGEIASDGLDATALVSSGNKQELDILGWAETQPDSVPFSYPYLRGVNYLPMASTSHCLHLAMIPMVGDPYADTSGGFFHEPYLINELDVLSSVGFNNIRFWGSFTGWCCGRTEYMASLKAVANQLRRRGMTMTYIMFNAIPAGIGTTPGTDARVLVNATGFNESLLRLALWSLSDAWQVNAGAPLSMPQNETDLTHISEPMDDVSWSAQGDYGSWIDTAFQTKVATYISDIATFFATDADGIAAFCSYDLYNEVNLLYAPNGVQSPVLRERLIKFMVRLYQDISAIHQNPACTVGWAGNSAGLSEEIMLRGCNLAYVSAHSYAYTASDAEYTHIDNVMAAAQAEAAALGIPFVLSEYYVIPENQGQLYRYIEIIARHGMGSQMWCYIQNNAYRTRLEVSQAARPFDGIVTCSTRAKSITRNQTLLFVPQSSLVLTDHNADHNADHGPVNPLSVTSMSADSVAAKQITEL